MNRLYARIIGNAILSFTVSFSSISLVSGGQLDALALQVGLIMATTHGLTSAAKELLIYGNANGAKPGKKTAKEEATKVLDAVGYF